MKRGNKVSVSLDKAVRELPEEVYFRLAETFAALADPSRAKIIYALLKGEMCVGDLASLAGISEPAASQHLRILRNLHLAKYRKAGRMIYYSLDDDHIRILMEVCLEHLGHL